MINTCCIEKMLELDDATVAHTFKWQHRSSGMGDRAMGFNEVAKHASEPLLSMRELRVTPLVDEPCYSVPPEEVYMLYEYDGVSWSTGLWSQKTFPRAIIVVPRKPRDWGAFTRQFTHRGCAFEICDHMSFTIFHLEAIESPLVR
jgi:hypothetical protein